MATTPLNLHTRPRTDSHKRENWSKIRDNFNTVETELEVVEGLFFQTLTNSNGSAVSFGQPVYADGAGSFDLAQANALATSDVIGLVFDATITSSGTGRVVMQGFVTGTTAQWDALTGGSGGLTAGSRYYVDPATAGDLTTTATTTATEVQIPIGVALSTTIMFVFKGERVLM